MKRTDQNTGKKAMKKMTAMMMASMMIISLVLTGCGSTAAGTAVQDATETVVETEAAEESAEETGEDPSQTSAAEVLTADDIEVNETITNSTDEEHAITADGETASYSSIAVEKTGDAEGDEADFYGANAAIFATNGATLDLSEITVSTDGTHANGVFSYGEGTNVNISDSVIETTGNCSGGLMTTGGGTMNASNLTIHTTGNSSAAIRSDRGGGTVNVTGGSYTTDGTGSPVIYSTADITVSDAQMESTAAQGVVVEGNNSVTLNNVNLTASNTTKNSDKSEWYQAVMIYQSMSGDAAEGLASFAMNGGTLTNLNGDIFFVNNTTARAAAAGWGSEGSNGGHVTMTGSGQTIDGDMVVDEVSSLNLYLTDSSNFTGVINTDGAAGDVYVEIEDGATWTLTGDSYITSLTCSAGSINLNGYKLYVNGEEYVEGSESEGEAIVVETSSSNSNHEGAPGSDGDSGHGLGSDGNDGPGSDGSTPPEKPDGDSSGHGPGSDGSEPPAKPGE